MEPREVLSPMTADTGKKQESFQRLVAMTNWVNTISTKMKNNDSNKENNLDTKNMAKNAETLKKMLTMHKRSREKKQATVYHKK